MGLVSTLGFLASCSPKPKELVTITYAAGPLAKEQQALVREVAAAFEKAFPHIHVEIKFERFDPLQPNLKTGPDVFLTSADDLPAQVAKEAVVDVTPMSTIEKNLMDPFYPEIAAACKLDNRHYMMPVNFTMDVLFYNQDLLIQIMREQRVAVNLQDLDWEALPQFAKAFVKKEGDRVVHYAFARPRPLLLIQSWGANPFAWNDVTIRNEQVRKALLFYASLATEHHLIPPPDSPEAAMLSIDLFKQQKVVMFVGPSELLAEADQIKDFKWDIAPAPKGPKRMQPGMPSPGSMEPPKPVEIWPRHGRLKVNGNCVWQNSTHFTEAWELTKFFSSEPAQRIFARVRGGMPAAKAVAEGTEFLRKPPEHVEVLISSRQHSRLENPHNLTFFQEFCEQAFDGTTDQLLRGKLTVDQAIDEMEAYGKSLMEQAKTKK